jgi:hypothetical protein
MKFSLDFTKNPKVTIDFGNSTYTFSLTKEGSKEVSDVINIIKSNKEDRGNYETLVGFDVPIEKFNDKYTICLRFDSYRGYINGIIVNKVVDKDELLSLIEKIKQYYDMLD